MDADTELDLFELSFADLDAIACDRNHPQYAEAGELLMQWQADEIASRTPAGGEA